MTNRFCLLISACTLFIVACGSGGSAAVMPPQGPTITSLYLVQGAGDSSQIIGSNITVSGVVTGDFQNGDANSRQNLGGFFIQSENPDADDETSDGLFIFDGSAPAVDVNVGDVVQVEGEVLEYFGETQLRATSVTITGSASFAPVDIALPNGLTTNSDGDDIADLERYEGMLVRVPQKLTVVSVYELERFGELMLAANGRNFQFTNQNLPDVAGYSAHQREFASRKLMLDDGLSQQNADPIRYLFPAPSQSPDYSVRLGDTVTGLTGNIRYSRGSGSSGTQTYRLVPQADPDFVNDNPREENPPQVGGSLSVATFNVLNYFTTIDAGQDNCGPAGDTNCRGADSSEEFARQSGKILHALTILDADIVGLIELANNSSGSITSLVDGLNDLAGSTVWSFIDTGTIGTDAIRVGLIYKTTTVLPVGAYAILDSSVDARFLDTSNRPVLLQTFEQRSNNEKISVAINHLKSKGSSCANIGDPDLHDGQENCSVTRTRAAQALADWLATDPTASSDPDFLIFGDLNSNLEEKPLSALAATGYVNLLKLYVGPDAYTFQFKGQSEALDNAFASPSLLDQVTGTAEWHISADEPRVFDYNLEFGRDLALFDMDSPFRASDHDPVVIGLSLNSN